MISFQVKINPSLLLTRIRENIKKEYEGELKGTDKNGTISLIMPIIGVFEGSYSFKGQQLEITLTKKPEFIGNGICEAHVRKYIQSFDY